MAGKAGYDEDQLKFLAQHGGIVPVFVRLTGKRDVEKCKRRAPDARMFESFNPDQERAFHRIAAAVKIRVMGMGYKPSNLHRVDGGKGGSFVYAREIDLLGDYDEWHARCKRKKLKVLVAMDILAFGMNISESAEYRKLNWRTVRGILNLCLNQYDERRGREKGKYDGE